MKMSQFQILLAASALACAPTYAADVAAGQTKAEEVCADCHGDDGKGDDESPDIVKLSPKEFVTAGGIPDRCPHQEREDGPAAKRLSPVDVANLAAYYETLK